MRTVDYGEVLNAVRYSARHNAGRCMPQTRLRPTCRVQWMKRTWRSSHTLEAL